MKLSIVVCAATLGLVAPALAQSPVPDQVPTVMPAPNDAPAPGGGGARDIRQACREEVRGQGLRGPDRMRAVSACVVKQRPDLAQREQCRMDGRGKGLRKDELRSFVRDCVRGRG